MDNNPFHIDIQAAKNSIFGQRIVHGILVSGLISANIGNHLPGPGSIYLGQNLRFTNPVYLNEEIFCEVEISSIRTDKPIITLETKCYKKDNTIVISGEAIVLCK